MKKMISYVVLILSLALALNILIIMISSIQSRKETLERIIKDKTQEIEIEKKGVC